MLAQSWHHRWFKLPRYRFCASIRYSNRQALGRGYGEVAMMSEGVIVWVLTGLIAGSLTNQFMPGRGYGIEANLVIGVVGAFVGGFAVSFGLPGQAGLLGTILAALAGAVVLTRLARARPGRSPTSYGA